MKGHDRVGISVYIKKTKKNIKVDIRVHPVLEDPAGVRISAAYTCIYLCVFTNSDL